MASLITRKLDEAVKARLRLRAARHGRSLEEEARRILTAAVALDDTGGDAADAGARPENAVPAAPSGAPESEIAATLKGRRVLLVIGGGIAAYKSLDLIRRLRERGAAVRVVMTGAAQEFVTPLAAGALAGGHVFTDLFSPAEEFDVGHIRLARDTDLIVVAPATADLMAKAAHGLAPDLAGAVLLATDRPVLMAPAMNPQMWKHAATRRNVETLRGDGVAFVGPNSGAMAESGESGRGRMAEPLEIVAAAEALLAPLRAAPLQGRRVLVTAGPTHEPIDPVRYIANRSSGKQGYAIAVAAAAAGADVTLVSGPVTMPDPAGVTVRRVEFADEMLAAVRAALPADAAVFAAAVADWRVAPQAQKIKKEPGAPPPQFLLRENPDILSTVAHLPQGRPRLVVGFAAETSDVIANGRAKLARKGCDWIVANDVSHEHGVMGGDANTVHLITGDAVESWPTQSKQGVAERLVGRIAAALGAR